MKIFKLLAAIILLGLAFIWYWPSCGYGNSKVDSIRGACLSNLKQLALAVALYAEDHNGLTPAAGWSGMQAFSKRATKVADLTCPKVFVLNRKGGYAMNPSVAGISFRKAKNPERTVAFFETDSFGPSPIEPLSARVRDRHEGVSNVAYLDGHVRKIPKDQEP